MFQFRCSSAGLSLAIVVTCMLASSEPPLFAQHTAVLASIKLKEPVASRVYQRDASGKADIPIILEDSSKNFSLSEMNINGPVGMVPGTKLIDGKVVGVPVGGPYTIGCRFNEDKRVITAAVGPVFVGDLWVLAGQSNMEGLGDLVDVTQPHGQVTLLGMDGKWRQAEEPLHWLVDSPAPIHSGDPTTRAERSRRAPAVGVPISLADSNTGGLTPERHIAGFSIRKHDGGVIPLIYESVLIPARDTVVLKLSGPIPEQAALWYGYGLDPYCSQTGYADMAVPTFGPIALDDIRNETLATSDGGDQPAGRSRF
jgi:hypothetical protein